MGFTIFNFRLYFQVFNDISFFKILLVFLGFVLVVYGGIILFYADRNKKENKPTQPLVLKIVRMVVLAGFFFFVVLEPVFVKINKGKNFYKKPTVALALDFSRSMAITKRAQEVLRWLDTNEKILKENFDLKIFAFGLAGPNYIREFKDTQELKNYFASSAKSSEEKNNIPPFLISKKSANRTNIPLAVFYILSISGKQTGQVEDNREDTREMSFLDGILLVSDGVNTADEENEAFSLSAKPQNNNINQRNKENESAPIFPLNIFSNDSKNPPDISILSIDAPAYAFKGLDIPVSVKIKKRSTSDFTRSYSSPPTKVVLSVKGFFTTDKNTEIPAGTSQEEDDIKQKGYVFSINKELAEGVNEIKLNIPAPPGARTGKISYTVYVSTFSWEITNENNRKSFSIEILRDKIRILYLCGRPSYEYSFLRDFIKNDLGFELVTFVILRNVDDVVLVPDEELSLIPFPGADLIIKQLKDFNVVIFDNFTYQRFGIYPQHLDMLKKWVAAGGGFLMIGGENSFVQGGYANTGVAEMLPVVLEKDMPYRLEVGKFTPVVAKVGQDKSYYDEDDFIKEWFNLWQQQEEQQQQHQQSTGAGSQKNSPLQGAVGDERNKFLYKLPLLEGVQVLRPHKDSRVVLSHPWVKVDQSRSSTLAPVLAFRDFGKGRTAALLTNTTWRWKMSNEAPVGFYESFWKAVINYLASSLDKDAGQMKVIGLKKVVGDDENLNFIVKKRYPSSRLSVILTKPDGSRSILEPLNWGQKENIRSRMGIGRKDETGYLMFSFTGMGASGIWGDGGRYLIEVADEVTDKKVRPRIKKETFKVRVISGGDLSKGGPWDESAEISYLDVNENYLKILSMRSGGVYFEDVFYGVAAISDDIKKRILSRRGMPPYNEGDEFATNSEKAGLSSRVIWIPSENFKVVVFVFMVLIVLELIIRRKKYGLW